MTTTSSSARRELLQRLELPVASGLAPSGEGPVLRSVAGIRILAQELPELEDWDGRTDQGLLSEVWGLLRASEAAHLDDLLDEARDWAAMPVGLATEAVLGRALLDLHGLGVVDWHAESDEQPAAAEDVEDDEEEVEVAAGSLDEDDDDGEADDDEDEDEDDGEDEEEEVEAKADEEEGYVQFVDLDAAEQAHWMWKGLVGKGAMPREELIRTAAEFLRSEGLASYRRLHATSRLHKAIRTGLGRGLREGRFDKPNRGERRAIISKKELRDWPKKQRRRLWRDCLIEVLRDEGPLDRDDAIRATAERAREVYGLRFKRLPSDGIYARWIRTAINGAIRRGLIDKLDQRRIGLKPEPGTEGPTPTPVGTEGPSGPALGDLHLQLEPFEIAASFEVLVLQLRVPADARDDVVQAVRDALVTEWQGHAPPPGQRWLAMVGWDVPHHMGHSLWIGLSRNVPAAVAGGLQSSLEAGGIQVQREMARAAHHGLMPILGRDEQAIDIFIADGMSLPIDALCDVGQGVDVCLRAWTYV